ncbi:hypothetical protein GCK72_004485 [Caenorhabditis remanei]|uniref:Secreted protein n=1 Tax=Caenorhabditis remanei TaxID=31234 RepID=A0A6A5HCH8_CAERE|nr:hypothetical protein GCK72_004485 [Caenorhabditis remanei]KAF1764536.1 hypothetical protein GCK72_004485 [Caenorhabditis remanei]
MKLQLLLLLSAVVYGAAQTTPSPLTVALNCVQDKSNDVIQNYNAAVQAAVNGEIFCLTEATANGQAALSDIYSEFFVLLAEVTSVPGQCSDFIQTAFNQIIEGVANCLSQRLQSSYTAVNQAVIVNLNAILQQSEGCGLICRTTQITAAVIAIPLQVVSVAAELTIGATNCVAIIGK